MEVAAYRTALYTLRPGPALSPLGTRLHSIAEVLPDAAPTCDIVPINTVVVLVSTYSPVML